MSAAKMREDLDAKLDSLNVMLKNVERAFFERGFRARAGVVLDKRHMLVFGKLANEYRLIFETWKGREMVTQTPLTNAPLEYRLQVPNHLDDLVKALEVAHEEQSKLTVEQLEKTASFLSKFCNCQNPDCPIGCPDAHATDCGEA